MSTFNIDDEVWYFNNIFAPQKCKIISVRSEGTYNIFGKYIDTQVLKENLYRLPEDRQQLLSEIHKSISWLSSIANIILEEKEEDYLNRKK